MLISQALRHFVRGQEIACLVGQHGSAHIQHANVLNGDRPIGLGFESENQRLVWALYIWIFFVIYHPCFINPNPHLNFHPQHIGCLSRVPFWRAESHGCWMQLQDLMRMLPKRRRKKEIKQSYPNKIDEITEIDDKYYVEIHGIQNLRRWFKTTNPTGVGHSRTE